MNVNTLTLALFLVLPPGLSFANGPSKGGSSQPAASDAPAEPRAKTVTLTIEPRYLRDNPSGNTIVFEPDSDRRSASYTKYHFARGPFLAAVGGALPTEAFTAVIQIDKTTQENSSGAKGGSSPVGGFNLTHHTARLVSTKGIKGTAGTTGTARRPAAAADTFCTEETGAKRTLTFINNHDFGVTIHWLSESCEPSLIQLIPANERTSISTFNGHVFVLRNADSGEVRTKMRVSPKGGDNVVIR